jgi:hypothetical protein
VTQTITCFLSRKIKNKLSLNFKAYKRRGSEVPNPGELEKRSPKKYIFCFKEETTACRDREERECASLSSTHTVRVRRRFGKTVAVGGGSGGGGWTAPGELHR